MTGKRNAMALILIITIFTMAMILIKEMQYYLMLMKQKAGLL